MSASSLTRRLSRARFSGFGCRWLFLKPSSAPTETTSSSLLSSSHLSPSSSSSSTSSWLSTLHRAPSRFEKLGWVPAGLFTTLMRRARLVGAGGGGGGGIGGGRGGGG